MSGNTIIDSVGTCQDVAKPREGWYDTLTTEAGAFARQSDLSDGATIALHQLVRRAVLIERRRCSIVGRLAQLEGNLVDDKILKEPT